jgi:uncharacterized membrane protein
VEVVSLVTTSHSNTKIENLTKVDSTEEQMIANHLLNAANSHRLTLQETDNVSLSTAGLKESLALVTNLYKAGKISAPSLEILIGHVCSVFIENEAERMIFKVLGHSFSKLSRLNALL